MRNPDLVLDLADPTVRMRNIEVFIRHQNWLAGLLLRIIKGYLVEVHWYEEEIGGGYGEDKT